MAERLAEIKKWAKLPDKEWVARHVPRFRKVRRRYVAYEGFLKEVLKQACRKLAPLAVVEARVKSIASFAEKILRKRKLYVDPKDPLPPDPLVRITDLCGGRVITQTADQVQAVCRFIEQAFDIDERNSEDVSNRLKPTEFGYRSVHYIVTVNRRKLRAAGITVPIRANLRSQRPLKAEIQVRTMLEHTWADIGHEMTYKTELRIPDRIHREFATLAAVLEAVDREFGRLVHGFTVFKSNFGAYHTHKEVEDEIARLQIVLSQDDTNLDLAVRIAQLALAIGQHRIALGILKPYVAEKHQGVERTRGITLTELHWDKPTSNAYKQGHRSLAAACAHPNGDAETLCAMAESWAHLGDDAKARELFRQAAAADATEPVTLSRYVEFEIAHVGNNSVVHLVAPLIRNSMDRCRKEIEARVNLPRAWASLGVLHLLMGEPFEALKAIAQVIRLCGPGTKAPAGAAGTGGTPRHRCAAGRALLRVREALKRMECIRELTPGFDWCHRAVLLGLAVRVKDTDAVKELQSLASQNTRIQGQKPDFSKERNIVILSGGCAPEVKKAINRFKPIMLRACKDLELALLSGGTKSGISALAGDIAEQSHGRTRAFGYLPRLPLGVEEDRKRARYVGNSQSTATDFTPLDPLRGWTDLILAGVQPHRVKLIGYAGRMISCCEYAMAVALGAHVGVVQDPALPKDRQFNDPDWQSCPNLVGLPMDAMTLRAFLLVDELPCERKKFKKAAQKTHEEYVKSAVPKEPSLLPWDELPEDLKVSNYHQVAYAENILKTAGLGVCKCANPNKRLLNMKDAVGKKGITRLAEMEHGRWNVERLLLGWHYDANKDVARKLSPYLVPWDKLPQHIQQYDLRAIESLPTKFREAKLEVYRLGRNRVK